jgi:hypothetical protein
MYSIVNDVPEDGLYGPKHVGVHKITNISGHMCNYEIRKNFLVIIYYVYQNKLNQILRSKFVTAVTFIFTLF